MPIVADTFWSVRTLSDVVGILSLVIGVASIWIAWYLARRDLRKVVDEAERRARDAIRRVATAQSQSQIGSAIQNFREARDAIRAKDWYRAIIRVEDGQSRLERVLETCRMNEAERLACRQHQDFMRVVLRTLTPFIRPNPKEDLSAVSYNRIVEGVTATLHFLDRLDAALQARPLEELDGQRTSTGPTASRPQEAPAPNSEQSSGMGRPDADGL